MKKSKLLFTVGGNINWCSQYVESLNIKIELQNYHMISNPTDGYITKKKWKQGLEEICALS